MRPDIDKSVYLNRIKEGKKWEKRVANWLRRDGWEVEELNEHERNGLDDGDLLAWGKEGYTKDNPMRVEVKHKNITFTSKEDCQHPTIFGPSVGAYMRLAKKGLKPHKYFIINRDGDYVAEIDTETEDQWKIAHSVPDRTYSLKGGGYWRQDYFEFPLRVVEFRRFE